MSKAGPSNSQKNGKDIRLDFELPRPNLQEFLEFLPSLENYTTWISKDVTSTYMKCAGFSTNDPRVVKLVSLAAQKYLSDLTNDAFHYYQVRTSNRLRNRNVNDHHVLSMDDLTQALARHGIEAGKEPAHFV